jgi:hypothetical protein
MNYFENMLGVLGQCVTLLVETQPVLFVFTLLAGVILAALCWWGATHYSRLFNLTFQITRLHQVLCAFAGLLTLLFCVLFVSLKFTRQIAQQAIEAWTQKVSDGYWQNGVNIKLYYAIKATGAEDFSSFPQPVRGKAFHMPVNAPSSKHLLASVPANEALHLFRSDNPYLSHVLSLPVRMPDAPAINDANTFFAQFPGRIYPLERAFGLTEAAIRSRLDPETPKAVLYARLILTGFFLLAQAIPFLWIGYAAYRDLQVRV